MHSPQPSFSRSFSRQILRRFSRSLLLVSIPLGFYLPAAIAQTSPRPSIFSEPPYNRTSPDSTPASPIIPPPEQRQPPSAILPAVDGKVNVTLINQTGAVITYQVVGDTAVRTLTGQSSVTLQDLKVPVNLTFRRVDHGLLMVSPKVSTTPGTLEVTFNETTDLGIDKTSMAIEANGDVFLN